MRRECSAQVIRFEDGMRHHALLVPDDVGSAFRERGIRRVVLEIGGIVYRRALQRKKDGRWYIVLGQGIMKETGLEVGESVTVVIREDSDSDFVEIGEEFAEVLEQDPEAKARWDTFPVGKKRSLALYVTGAKKSETRIRRGLELAEKIRTHTLHDD